MTHLYLIRHGQAINATKKVVGDSRLSPLGIVQAERLRSRLAATHEIQADVLISSTMLRARHTAEIIAPALGLPIIFDEEFEEWRDGDAVGMPEKEYLALFWSIPLEQRALRRTVHKAESWAEFHLRIANAYHRIQHEYDGKTVVIVCHGGVIESTIPIFSGHNTLHFPPVFLGNTRNTSLTHWHRTNIGDFSTMWMLDYYNDFTHIRDIDTQGRIDWHNLAHTEKAGASEIQTPTQAE